MGWDREFSEPILLPKGKKLTTLRDAALYITKLPKAEHDADEWQVAMEALLPVARSSIRCKVRSRLRAVFLLNEKIGYHRRM
jgi:hypothetical protein